MYGKDNSKGHGKQNGKGGARAVEGLPPDNAKDGTKYTTALYRPMCECGEKHNLWSGWFCQCCAGPLVDRHIDSGAAGPNAKSGANVNANGKPPVFSGAYVAGGNGSAKGVGENQLC